MNEVGKVMPLSELLERYTKERDRAEVRAEAAEKRAEQAGMDRDAAIRRAEAAEAQCAAMRAALEEHVRVGPHRTYCLRCDAGGRSEMGHSSGCLIGQALATDAGAKMLAEVKRLRWFAEEIKLSCDEKEYTAEEIVTQVEATIVGFDSGEAAG